MNNLSYIAFLRLCCGHCFMHNKRFPPEFAAEFDHTGMHIDYCGRTLNAGWYSALENTWNGRCNIVLSGPSIKTIAHPRLLARSFSIWVNNSPTLALAVGVQPSMYLVADPDFIERQYDSFEKFSAISESCMISFAGASQLLEAGSPVERPFYVFDDMRFPFRRRYIRGSDSHSLNSINNCHTVATTAVRAAMLMGFTEIYIFGLDLGGTERFYAEAKPEPSRLDSYHEEICAEFRKIAAEAREKGVKLVNCSPVSRLPVDIMEIRDPNDALAGSLASVYC